MTVSNFYKMKDEIKKEKAEKRKYGVRNMQTELEKKLWRMLYKSQVALAKRELADMNANREEENDWPAGQEWHECDGSSHAIFFRKARERCGIDDAEYLEIVREVL